MDGHAKVGKVADVPGRMGAEDRHAESYIRMRTIGTARASSRKHGHGGGVTSAVERFPVIIGLWRGGATTDAQRCRTEAREWQEMQCGEGTSVGVGQSWALATA